MKIKAVKPKIWNFEVVKGEDAWKEIVYSARMSGVPPTVEGKDIFEMIIKNDYGSALEHIIIKFDIQMTKGNAPELLEHRMASHSGYSTRYIKADEGAGKKEPIYEIVMPLHLLKEDPDSKNSNKVIFSARLTYSLIVQALFFVIDSLISSAIFSKLLRFLILSMTLYIYTLFIFPVN